MEVQEHLGNRNKMVDRRSILALGSSNKKVIKIKIYCAQKGCDKYIEGDFYTETGVFVESKSRQAIEADMVWVCHEHLH